MVQFLGLGKARKWGTNGSKVETQTTSPSEQAEAQPFTAAEVHYCLLRPAKTAPRRPGPAAGEEEEPAAGSLEGIVAAGGAGEGGSRAAAGAGVAAAASSAAAAAAEQNRRFHKPRCWRNASARCRAPGNARPRPLEGRCPSQRLCFFSCCREKEGEGKGLVKRESHEVVFPRRVFSRPPLVQQNKMKTNLDALPDKTAAVAAPRRAAASGSRTAGAGSRSLERGRGRDHPSDRRHRERRRRRALLALVPQNSRARGPFRRAFPAAEQPAEFN